MHSLTIQEFLKEHAYLIFTRSYFQPCFEVSTVGVIPEKDVGLFAAVCEGFSEAVVRQRPLKGEEAEDYSRLIHGVRVTGDKFIMSSYGLYYILPDEVDFDHYSKNDIRVVWPEDVVEKMQTGIIPANKTVFKYVSLTSRSVIEEIEQQHKTRIEKEALQKKQYAEKKVLFFAIFGEEHKELAERLWNFDIHYSYSDDIKVYRNGVEKQALLEKELEEKGFGSKGVFYSLHQARSVI